MKKTLIFFGILLIGMSSYGQRKSLADRFFKDYAYKKSAELYKRIYEKGDSSRLVLRRLGDSYYFNGDTKQAEKWYEKLMKSVYAKQDKASVADDEYLFRYVQSLKMNGKYAESDKWLLKLRPTDDRGESLASNPNYYSEYSKRKNFHINIHNVSANTEYSDFGTFINGKTVFFASTRPTKRHNRLYKWNQQPFLNLYAVKERDLVLEGPENKVKELDLPAVYLLPGEVNTRYHEAMGAITKDGKTMYFTRDDYDGRRLRKSKKKTTHLKLYKATLVASKWQEIKELPFSNSAYSVGHPALSPDEKTLYFISDMPGGYGYTDIYKVAILGNNTYGTPENLGKTINTEGREMFPYVDSESTLYFSSNGHIGLGGLDIFKSKLLKDGKYAKPHNLGVPFNSRSDDFALVFDKLNVSGYFSSNRSGGKGDDDIYSFDMFICTKNIAGVVTDNKTKEVLASAKVRLINAKGQVLSKTTTDAQGKYLFEKIACDELYTLAGNKLDYKQNNKQVSTIDVKANVVRADLALEPLIVENQIVINPIHFDFDKYNIREDAKYELEHIVTVMENHPDMVIKIASHTDSRGSKAYNQILSDNRAKATRDYIISRGIAKNRIESAIGYGESHLLNNCDDAHQDKCTEAQHQENRRSYFYIVKGGKNISSSNEERDK